MAKQQNKQPVNNPAQPEPTNSNKIQNEALAIERDMADLSVKMIENDKQRELILQRIKKLRVDINKNTELDKDQTKQLLTLMREGIKLTTIRNNNDDKTRKKQDRTLKLLQSQGDELRDIVTTEKKIEKLIKTKKSTLKEIENSSAKDKDLKQRALVLDIDAAEKLKKELTMRKEILLASDEARKIAEENAKREKQIQDIQESTVKNQLSILDTIDKQIRNKIPIIGDVIADNLNIDKLKTDLTKTLLDTAKSQTGKKGLVGALSGGFKSLTGMLSGLGGILRAALAPLMPILAPIALIAGVALIAKKFSDIRDKAIDTQRELGLSTESANSFNLNIANAANSAGKFGLNLINAQEEMRAVNMEFASQVGRNLEMSQEALQMGGYLMKNYKMTAEEANAVLMATAASGMSVKDNIVLVTALTDKYKKQGVNIIKTFKNISQASETVLANYKNQIKSLFNADIMAQKYNLTLDQMNTSAQGLLNIEQSLEDEMTANVLTGKQMNFNEARRLAQLGKTSEAMDKLLGQNVSYNELVNMQPLQRDAIAKAMNMETDQLLKSMRYQEIINKLSATQVDQLQAMSAAELDRTEAKILGLSEEEKADMLAQKASLKASELTETAMAKLSLLIDRIAMSGLSGLIFGGDLKERYKEAGLTVPDEKRPVEKSKQAQAREERLIDTKMTQVPAKDFVFRENGGLQTFSKGDLIMGIDEKSLSSYSNTNRNDASGNGTSTEAITLLKTQNELLGKLLQKVDQPVKMNIGGRVIEELDSQASLRRSYTAGVDKSYRSF